ncbi:hypothetical protein [Dyella nitratireducens]|uniref:DUF1579 domain-containing protein n=1 Tax=Dyella nitratireducens TaxID=1849580 RepID=A0ABQ1GCM6_9GAMM|nr:hypothetical protein [Dyella nitratireducens]GGA41012.1 hypothetical protein GCM10010981_32760 [Dyella nitratireducens]GLQ40634.1 hypothetical protein GCM10007902_04830 [Dyella nitratireducens]
MSLLRYAVSATLVVVATIATGLPARASQDEPKPQQTPNLSGVHDFDFFIGSWRTHSRRLKYRLVGSHDWEEFDGTIRSFSLMGGLANVDDTEFDTPEGIYRGVAPRAYDPKTGLWAIWWIDGRNPHGALDPPVKGRFVHGIGTFYASDTLRGKPIKVRFTWSQITPNTAHWEQAYSGDDGRTWETNWIQDVRRVK